ncbi:MAG TPA: acyltransferase [Xanthobacteraceae bacterium]|nr:acyltransferase [Xanthobacteraceae bacterium]
MGLVRLFFAYIVAVGHWRALALTPRGIDLRDSFELHITSGHAVLFFYVISGFLITYTLSTNYASNSTGIAAFYRNRAVRIFSGYWPVVLLAFITIPGAWLAFASASVADQFAGLFLFTMDWRTAFAEYPAVHWGSSIVGLHQAWTLGAEMTFYLMAPLLMRSWKLAFVLLAASAAWRLGFVAINGGAINDVWTYHFAVSTIGFFMLGHLACVAAKRFKINPVIGVLLTVAAFVTMVLAPRGEFDGPRFWIATLLFAGGLPGLFAATKSNRWLNYLGDLSYPLYLTHPLVFIWWGDDIAQAVLSHVDVTRMRAPFLSTGAFLVAAIAVAIIFHHAIEAPIANALKSKQRRAELDDVVGDQGRLREQGELPP